MNRTTPEAVPTTSRPQRPSWMLTSAPSLRSDSASSPATSRHRPPVLGAAYAAMVKRPLAVTTHTALGMPASVSSTCSWADAGIGSSTEPRSRRPSVAVAESSKSSRSNGPSASSATGFSTGASRFRCAPTKSGSSIGCCLDLRLPNAISQARMSTGGAVAAVATGSIGQPGLVERGHLDQVEQLDSLHQQLGNAVTAADDDRHRGVEIYQCDLDLTTVTRVDSAGAVDDRKPHPRS